VDTLAPVTLDREALAARYRANRTRSHQIFELMTPEAYLDTPIPLRHPFVFYDGHLPGFAFLTLVRDALGRPSIDPELERLFNRGIDPATSSAASAHRRAQWPDRATIRAFGDACDAAILDAYATARLDDPTRPALVRAEAAYTILEHEEMHHETLMYIVRMLAREKQRPWAQYEHRDVMPPAHGPIAVPAGIATIGADRDALAFGWDNEFDRVEERVGAFGIDAYDVTNGDWLRFVDDGGPVPPQWIRRDGAWLLRGVFEDLPLPKSWPVYVSNEMAAAYCAWTGTRLPTEAEYHRAAYGSPSGERAFPWGDAAPDPAKHGNFGWRRVDPEPVGSSPAGASAWGVHDLIGNGWEWTSTPFAPLPGFTPMASYPPYSADFFDGKHAVMLGAGPATASALPRRSLRNWFYTDYPYMDATFRRVHD